VRLLDEVVPVVEDIVEEATAAVADGVERASVEIDVDVGDGVRLVGTVADVIGDVVRTVTYSRVGARQRLATWVRLLAVTASHPARAFSAVTIGRGHDGVGTAAIAPLGDDPDARRTAAVAHLRVLVDLHQRGLCEPLPLYCRTSAAYAAAPRSRRDSRARQEWKSRDWDQEDREPEHQLVLGGVVPFDDLLLWPPADGEDGAGWDADEPTRFGRLAVRLWGGLLACETRRNL
jgi:exodeoxyribonuclease V gamma subunit